MKRTSQAAAGVALVAALLTAVNACVFTYTTGDTHSANPVFQTAGRGLRAAGGTWDYTFFGEDWQDDGWVCASGSMQSPVNLMNATGMARMPEALRTRFAFGQLKSDGANVRVINTGRTIQVEWDSSALVSNEATVAYVPGGAPPGLPPHFSILQPGQQAAQPQRASLLPLQFHFHSTSEHMVDGALYAMEGHIVSRVVGLPGCGDPAPDCFAVLGMMFKLDPSLQEAGSPLELVLANPPNASLQASPLLPAGATFDFQRLMPSDPSYITYQGSLTTPPCSEVVLWHVLTVPLSISPKQYRRFLEATGTVNGSCSDPDAGGSRTCPHSTLGVTNRLVQPQNGRALYVYRPAQPQAPPPPHHMVVVPDDPTKAMETGAVVGIVIGSVLGTVLAGVIAWAAYRRYKRKLHDLVHSVAGTFGASTRDPCMSMDSPPEQRRLLAAASSPSRTSAEIA